MKRIKLTGKNGKGKFAIIDNEDFEYLSKFNWHLYNNGYARRRAPRDGGNRKSFYMHKVIMKVKNTVLIDHKNRNGLDNRKKNLRVCTFSENSINTKIRIDNHSGLRGVSWREKQKTWMVRIWINGKCKYLGCFKLKNEAAKMYNKVAKREYGEFAYLNKI